MARVDLRDNEYIERFVGQDHINSNDVTFWYQLLSCSFNFMRVQDPRYVEKTLDPYLVRLTLNNSSSSNIGSLLRVFVDRVSRAKSPSGQSINPYYVFQSFNALYLIKSICKSYIESLSEEQLIKAFRARIDPVGTQVAQTPKPQQPVPLQQTTIQSPQVPSPNVDPQISASSHQTQLPTNSMPSDQAVSQMDQNSIPATINNVIAQQASATAQPNATQNMGDESMSAAGPKLPATPAVQESDKKIEFTSGSSMLDQFISTLIAILVDIPQTDSTYLLQVESINALLVLLSVQMYSNTPANQSTIYKCLMQKKCSIHALILTKTLLTNFVNQQPVPQDSGSIIIGLASGIWKVLTLGYGGQDEEAEVENIPLLAKQSLLLLNILTNHYSCEKNPYREAIVSCQDSEYNLSDPKMAFDNANNDALATASTSKSVLMSNSIKIDFHKLYETICKYLNNDQVALLLYLLLHSNKIFRPYILTTASKELDRLLLPLLKILYTSIEKGSHHVYMVLIIFVILSEETSFNEVIHKITVKGVPWYKDRLLSEISLGSLTALIIIRSFQYNTFRIRDKFLHTNLFATLANLSNHFYKLHPYVCQRIVDLLERLSKRYSIANKRSLPPNKTLKVLNADNPLAKALATDSQPNKLQDLQDASSIEIDSTSSPSTMHNNNSSAHESGGNNAINIDIPDPRQDVPPQAAASNGAVVLPAMDMNGKEFRVNAEGGGSSSSGQQSPNSNSTSDHINISMDDSRQDDGLIEEVIRMILEVLYNSLAIQMKNNPDLIYTLLYKRNVISSLLSSHQSFYDMVINVERILTFFYNEIESFERSLSVDEIKDLINRTSQDWNSYHGSRDPSARLLFRYVEDEQPEEFFIPYIWTRIYYSSGIVWDSKRIVLFNPDDL